MPEATGEVAVETATTTTETTETTTTEPDLEKQVEHWKSMAKKNEQRAKENAKAATELEQFRQQSMTEQEKAVAAARDEGRSEGLRNAGARLVEAEVRAAAKGRVPDVDALLEVLDPSKFLGEDGEPDRDAIAAWVDRFAPEQDEQAPGFPVLEQGTRTTPLALGSDPLTDALKRMTGVR